MYEAELTSVSLSCFAAPFARLCRRCPSPAILILDTIHFIGVASELKRL